MNFYCRFMRVTKKSNYPLFEIHRHQFNNRPRMTWHKAGCSASLRGQLARGNPADY